MIRDISGNVYSIGNTTVCINDIEGSVLKGKSIIEIYPESSIATFIDSEGMVYEWNCYNNEITKVENISNQKIKNIVMDGSSLSDNGMNDVTLYITEEGEAYFYTTVQAEPN